MNAISCPQTSLTQMPETVCSCQETETMEGVATPLPPPDSALIHGFMPSSCQVSASKPPATFAMEWQRYLQQQGTWVIFSMNVVYRAFKGHSVQSPVCTAPQGCAIQTSVPPTSPACNACTNASSSHSSCAVASLSASANATSIRLSSSPSPSNGSVRPTRRHSTPPSRGTLPTHDDDAPCWKTC